MYSYFCAVAGYMAAVFNDTAVKNSDLAKFTQNQLTDERNRLITVTDQFEAKGDKLTPEELAAYRNDVERLEAVVNHISSTAVGLAERRNAALATAAVSNAAGGLVVNLAGGISTRPRWEDDKDKYGFNDQRDYLNAVVNLYRTRNPDSADPRLKRAVMDAIGSDEFSKANWEAQGIMVPRGFISTVMQIEPEADRLSAAMTRVTMTAPVVDIPCRVDKDHRTSVTGGFNVYRGKETAAPSMTKTAMELVSLKAHEINGAAAVTYQLMSDSPLSIADIIDQGLRQEARSFRMDELLNGNGIGRPLGMLNANNAALLTVLRENGQAAGSIVSGLNVLKMRKRVWGYENAVWLAPLDLYDTIFTLVIESPNNAGITKLFYSSTGGEMPDTLLGRPIIWTEYMPGISTGNDGNVISEWNEGFLACVNPTQMLFGERGTGTVTRSIHVRFLEREEVFLFTAFDDARPWWKSTFQPKNGGLTLSPFVVLSKTTA
jgi:HK97 family phage major capsid protein